MNISTFISCIETLFPPCFQEPWDNSGWNVNLHPERIDRILVCVDATESVIDKAARCGCNVIVSHHPLFFHATKNLDSSDRHGRLTKLLLAHGISVYCAHTSADNAPRGINTCLARRFGLENVRILAPSGVPLYKIVVTVPPESAPRVRRALFDAGAGRLGEYSDCAFTVSGQGTFRGSSASNPYTGTPGQRTEVAEERIEVVCSAEVLDDAKAAALRAHPYEMPALDVFPLRQQNPQVGSGAIGTLPEPMDLDAFVQMVKRELGGVSLRLKAADTKSVRTVALCGGAGGDFISDAEAQGADLFLSGEIKHNMFCDSSIALVETGHYVSEKIFVDIVAEALQKSDSMLKYDEDIVLSHGLECPYIDI